MVFEITIRGDRQEVGHELFSPGLEVFDLFFKGLKALFKGVIPLKSSYVTWSMTLPRKIEQFFLECQKQFTVPLSFHYHTT